MTDRAVRRVMEKYIRGLEVFEPQTVNQKMWEKVGIEVEMFNGKELINSIDNKDNKESVILAVRDAVIAGLKETSDFEMIGNLDNVKMKMTIYFDTGDKISF